MPDDKLNKNPELNDLEKKVDEMMDPNTPDRPEPSPEVPTTDGANKPLTAPEVPRALVDYVEMSEKLEGADEPSKDSEEVSEPPEVKQSIVEEELQDLNEPEEDVISHPVTDEAVKDIVRKESDELLAKRDEELNNEPALQQAKGWRQRVGQFFKSWWQNKKARYATIVALLLIIVGLAVWPQSRHAVLNFVGVRSSASIRIIDQGTKLPLKNVQVSIGSAKTKTNEDGTASFRLIKLGKQKLNIDRVAFETIDKDITIGWGSNPLGSVDLRATGARYEFMVSDYLSKKSIEAEAESGDASAISDKNGKIILTIDTVEKEIVEVTIKSDGYRNEKLVFAANKKDATNVEMVAAKPLVYVSKQSGRYDVYKMDVDGKNKAILLAGTGRERQSIAVSISPDGRDAVVVSSRGTNRDKNGYLMDTLTRINIKTSEAKVIDEAQNIRLTDWFKQRLVYVATYAAPSAATGDRQRLVSYDINESARNVLVSSDYFNGVASIGDYIYYVIASSDPNQTAGFQRIHPDGSNKTALLAKQVWTIIRTDFNKLSLETPEGWQEYNTLDKGSLSKSSAPTDYASRQYFVSGNGTKSVWIDARDGKGVLVIRDQKTHKEKVLTETGGLAAPIRWLNNSTVLYRVVNSSETADYVMSIDGGDPRKISDVTNYSGLSINF